MTRISVEPSRSVGIAPPSQIMVDKITTMPRGNVRDHLRSLTDADLIQIDRALLVFPGLARVSGLFA